MLIDFFLHLKQKRLPVTTTEYLSLLEALSAGLSNYSLNDFYSLARICLVKNESNYDKFDQAFSEYFENISVRGNSDADDLPDGWLNATAGQLLSSEDIALLENVLSDEPHEETRQFQDSEKESPAEEGKKMKGSNSLFGEASFQSDSIRLDNASAGNHRAIKAWESRQFQGLDDEVELGTRNIKMALRRLRKFAREGAADELDLDDTISCTARNAGWLDIKMRPERRNKIKVLILFDTGGSMDAHIKQCEELFSAARTEFKQLEYFYFHNCIADSVWRYNGPQLLSHYPVPYLTHKYGKDYKLIIVGDASMSPMEILQAGEGYNRQASTQAGEVWIRHLLDHYKHAVWLNPEPERFWRLTESIQIIRELMSNRMFPLTLSGIDQAMKALSK